MNYAPDMPGLANDEYLTKPHLRFRDKKSSKQQLLHPTPGGLAHLSEFSLENTQEAEMLIKVEIDLKPEELRHLLGLPDVAGLQEDMISYIRTKWHRG